MDHFIDWLVSVICTDICLRITSRQIWMDLFESHVCQKELIVVYMYVHERNLFLMFLHICRNSVKLH